MRDWFEQRLRGVLEERAAAELARPCGVGEIKRRARWLLVRYVGAAVLLVGCLVALVLTD